MQSSKGKNTMLKHKLIQDLGNALFGKDMTLAVTLLQLIAESMKKQQTGKLTASIYHLAPNSWKAPGGLANRAEFVDLAQTGQAFLAQIGEVLKTR
jgi:glucose-6-phosphate isomerase